MYSGEKQNYSNLTDCLILDCSYRNLDTIPPHLYNASLALEVNNNQLSNITGQPFKELVLLQSLILAHNSIAHITNDVFFRLSKLLLLDISYNKVQAIPTKIFSELVNLQVLDLGWNSLVQIPNEAVAPLQSLHILALDGNYFTSYFLGKEFKKLKHLEYLTIANTQPSLKQNITNETFQYLQMDQNKDTHLRLVWYPLFTTISSVGKLTNVKDFQLAIPPLDEFESVECPLQTLTIGLSKVMPSVVFNTQMFNRWNATLTNLSFDYGNVPSLHHGPI